MDLARENDRSEVPLTVQRSQRHLATKLFPGHAGWGGGGAGASSVQARAQWGWQRRVRRGTSPVGRGPSA